MLEIGHFYKILVVLWELVDKVIQFEIASVLSIETGKVVVDLIDLLDL
jgi:hypothetical protein